MTIQANVPPAKYVAGEILTLKQAAIFLKVSERTLWKMAKASQVPTFRVANQYRFSFDRLTQWVNSQTVEPTS